MILHELYLLVRNRRWKYLIVILLICSTFLMMDNVSISASMTMKESQYVISILPVFMCSFLLYRIALDAEQSNTWKTLFTYPVSLRRHYMTRVLILLLFQIPILLLGMLCYYLFSGTIDMMMFHYTLCFQLLYLLSHLWSTYAVSDGFLSVNNSITIVNVLYMVTPVFLLFCISNARDWVPFFHQIWLFIVIAVVIMILLLFYLLDVLMRRKLYREMMLFKIFGNNSPSFIMNSLQNLFQRISEWGGQSILRLLAGNHPYRWRIAASVSLCFKLNSFYMVAGAFALLLWINSGWLLFFFVFSICVLRIISECIKTHKKLKTIRIL